MKLEKKSLGLIILVAIIGGISIFTYINNGSDNLKSNSNNEDIFVEEDLSEDTLDTSKEEENEKSKNTNSKNNKSDEEISKEEITLKDKTIAVDIKGEVVKEGVYYLEEGSIVEDLIREAGGVTKDASLELVNRAEKLENNKCIVIPSKEEAKKMKEGNSKEGNSNIAAGDSRDSGGDASSTGDKDNKKININTATLEELDDINGIGPSKAQAIIAYRDENGGFKSIEDIKNVSGIGESTFSKIKDSITI